MSRRISDKPLFIPLMKPWFDAFKRGEKRVEYRVHGPRWNKRVCRDGRAVVLANGYGWPRLTASIERTRIVKAKNAPQAARDIFGDRELIAITVRDVSPLYQMRIDRASFKEENEG